jgi:glycosyltransferase involved in cell wall biosynthesis
MLENAGIKAKVIYAGVDVDRFRPAAPEEKSELRDKYGINQDSHVVLHVGHIQEGRNITALAGVASMPNTHVILVGSSSTSHDDGLKESLTSRGVRVLGGYIESIEEVYQLADVYLFPVTNPNAAIELPLSVLEAMACNLPVVTTKFGGLSDCFEEGGGLYFLDEAEQIPIKIATAGRSDDVRTREKVQSFTWSAVARRLLTEIAGLAE